MHVQEREVFQVSTQAQRPEDDYKSSVAEVISGCKPPNLGAGNQAWPSEGAARALIFWAIIQSLQFYFSLWQNK